MNTRNLQIRTKGRTESGVPRRARSMGYVVRKSRRCTSINNNVQYQLVHVYPNWIVAGERFDLSLYDVDVLLDEANNDIEKKKRDILSIQHQQ